MIRLIFLYKTVIFVIALVHRKSDKNRYLQQKQFIRSAMSEEPRTNRMDAFEGTSPQMSASSDEKTDSADSSEPLVKPGSSLISQRATIAGVFFDIALFVADVEHLKFIIDSGKESIDNYGLMLGLLCASLSVQFLVGFLLFVRGFAESPQTTKSDIKWTKIIDNIIVGLVSVIALVNVLVTVFGDRTESVAHYKQVYNCSTLRSF